MKYNQIDYRSKSVSLIPQQVPQFKDRHRRECKGFVQQHILRDISQCSAKAGMLAGSWQR